MKYLLLAAMLLTGCSTPQSQNAKTLEDVKFDIQIRQLQDAAQNKEAIAEKNTELAAVNIELKIARVRAQIDKLGERQASFQAKLNADSQPQPDDLRSLVENNDDPTILPPGYSGPCPAPNGQCIQFGETPFNGTP